MELEKNNISIASCQDVSLFSSVRSALVSDPRIDLDGRDPSAFAVYLMEYRGVFSADFDDKDIDHIARCRASFDDCYIGTFKSYSDFVSDLADDAVLANIPAGSLAARYFDYDQFGADLLFGGDYSAYYVDDDDMEEVDGRDIRGGFDPSFGRECVIFDNRA